MSTVPERDALDDKVNRTFAGKVVRKDFVRKVKVGANVPVFVLEFSLGKYCASSDEMAIQKMKRQDLHFHDLRGTAVTKFYIAGIPERVIAEIMGWSEDEVTKIIRRYVGRTAATLALIRQLNKKGT